MTCIVAIKKEGTVYMGADSACTADNSIMINTYKKVFINNGFLIGFTDSYRMGQLLQYSFKPPTYYKDKDLFGFMCTDFIKDVIDCFKENGYVANEENNNESITFSALFLVGFEGRIFKIDHDFQIAESSEDFDSIGCGMYHALGYLNGDTKSSPEDRINGALKTATKYSTGVEPPFFCLSLDETEDKTKNKFSNLKAKIVDNDNMYYEHTDGKIYDSLNMIKRIVLRKDLSPNYKTYRYTGFCYLNIPLYVNDTITYIYNNNRYRCTFTYYLDTGFKLIDKSDNNNIISFNYDFIITSINDVPILYNYKNPDPMSNKKSQCSLCYSLNNTNTIERDDNVFRVVLKCDSCGHQFK